MQDHHREKESGLRLSTPAGATADRHVPLGQALGVQVGPALRLAQRHHPLCCIRRLLVMSEPEGDSRLLQIWVMRHDRDRRQTAGASRRHRRQDQRPEPRRPREGSQYALQHPQCLGQRGSGPHWGRSPSTSNPTRSNARCKSRSNGSTRVDPVLVCHPTVCTRQFPLIRFVGYRSTCQTPTTRLRADRGLDEGNRRRLFVARSTDLRTRQQYGYLSSQRLSVFCRPQ